MIKKTPIKIIKQSVETALTVSSDLMVLLSGSRTPVKKEGFSDSYGVLSPLLKVRGGEWEL
jgi:hypothetical protein